LGAKKIKKKKKPLRPEEVETLAEQTLNFLRKNIRLVIAFTGFFLVISALLWGYGRYTSLQHEQAAYAYYAAVKTLSNNDVSIKDDDISIVLNQLEKLTKLYPSQSVAIMASLDELALLCRRGKWDEVVKIGERLKATISPDHPFYPLLIRHVAIAYTKGNHVDKALQAWNDFIAVAPKEWLREAYWEKARIFIEMGKKDEAVDCLRKALNSEGFLPADFVIKERLHSLSNAG